MGTLDFSVSYLLTVCSRFNKMISSLASITLFYFIFVNIFNFFMKRVLHSA